MTGRRRVDRIEWWRQLRASDASPSARLLALTLSTYMNPDGSDCFPGQDRLAASCGWADNRSVRKALAELQSLGFVEVERYAGPRPDGRAQATHRYWPTAPPDADQSDSQGREDVDQSDPEGREESTTTRPSGATTRPSHADQPDSQGRQPLQDLASSTPPGAGASADAGAGMWVKVVERLPRKVRDRIEAAPDQSVARLRDALSAAEAAGIRAVVLRGCWDDPTALDDDSIEDPAAVLAARIRQAVKRTDGRAA